MLHSGPATEQHDAQSDTRSHAEQTGIVDQGLQLARREGIGAAIEFMRKNGVPSEVIFRVLGDPRFHRPL